MPKMNLTHFEASLLFALFISVAMGLTTKKSARDQLMYGLYCLGCFLATLVGLSWLMKLGHG